MPATSAVRLNRGVSVDYRLARPVAAQLLGVALVAVAVLVMVGSVVAALVGAPFGALLGLAGLAVAVVVGAGWWVSRAWTPLRLDDDGYRLRLWRTSGVREARWREVGDAVATYAGDEPVVVLHLKDGRRTVIPVRLLDTDRDQLVRDLQEHLQRGHGIRRL